MGFNILEEYGVLSVHNCELISWGWWKVTKWTADPLHLEQIKCEFKTRKNMNLKG